MEQGFIQILFSLSHNLSGGQSSLYWQTGVGGTGKYVRPANKCTRTSYTIDRNKFFKSRMLFNELALS